MKLHFRTIGEGKPLIILHGLFGSSDNWQTLAKVFTDHHKVYLVDQRNHGHSGFSDEMDYDVMADDLKELIITEQIHKPDIIGHSMGGKTVLFFAQRYPELIDRMIIVDMGLKKYPPHHDLIFEALLSVDLDKIKSRKEAEEIMKMKITDFSVMQFLLKNLYWSEKEKLDWRFNLQVLYREIEQILAAVPAGKINVPTLFIRGEKSNYILESDYESIREQIPDVQFITIKNVGHWVHAEAPKEFADVVKNYLDQ